MGVVLMQNHHPIVYESRKLRDNEKLYSTYKEMLAIMHALTKFRQYLVGRKFLVKTSMKGSKNGLVRSKLMILTLNMSRGRRM